MTGAHPASAPGGRGRFGGDLSLRVISSVALAPLAIGSAYWGGWIFALFWLAAALVVLWEWNGLVLSERARPGTVAGGVALIAAVVAMTGRWLAVGAFLLAVSAAAAAVLAPAERRVWAAMGVLYASWIVVAPIILRLDAGYGFVAMLLLFAVVWGTDIAAYFGGRAIGGPKLWPKVTPKKTWSGAIVGALAAVAAGVGVGWAAELGNLAALAAVCLILSVASQAGDLLESAIKRRFGAKDASHLIPGHGGFMDRLDGFAAAALVAAVFGVWRGGLHAPSRGLLIW